MANIRAIRFSKDDQAMIEEFLNKNRFLDFSTLTRMAIIKFIAKPEFDFRPVGPLRPQGAVTQVRSKNPSKLGAKKNV